jgi:RNA 2',3'-cyclic 3'-phosphodiesterase
MGSFRTFIALELPEELKKSLGRLQAKFKEFASGVKWVRPENIHLTLKFLGDINPDRVAPVSAVLERLAHDAAPFLLDVAGIGAFPNDRNPKVLWAGMQIDDRLHVFQQEIETALAATGFAREQRPFAPHLTLGRLRDGRARRDIAGLIEQYSSERFGRFTADRIVFFKSELQPSGPVYEAIKNITLMKNA